MRFRQGEAPREERAARHRSLAPELSDCDQVVDRRDAPGCDHRQSRDEYLAEELDVGSRERSVARGARHEQPSDPCCGAVMRECRSRRARASRPAVDRDLAVTDVDRDDELIGEPGGCRAEEGGGERGSPDHHAVGTRCDRVGDGALGAVAASDLERSARLGGYDAVLLDTAGRITLDEAMMAEAAEVERAANPHEVLLVADALTGQDAVNMARAFNERVGLTGIVLTRVDGDGRGGAALSMRAVTGKPIKLIGTGEKVDALEDFHPARIADRILGMGDIVSLVEKAAATIDAEKAARTAERMRKGAFDLNDLREQLGQMQRMGGLGGLMGMLPGIAKMKNQIAAANLNENMLKHQVAIIDSMTPRERRNPDLLKASRKKRVAAGSGAKVEDINKLLKMHRTMADMMKAMGSGKRGPLAGLANMMGMGGGMPSPEELAKLAEKMPGGMPPGLPGGSPGAPGLPPTMPGLPPKLPGALPGGLPGLGGKLPGGALPGLGGFPGLGKKK